MPEKRPDENPNRLHRVRIGLAIAAHGFWPALRPFVERAILYLPLEPSDIPNGTIGWANEYLKTAITFDDLGLRGFDEMRQKARFSQITVWGRPEMSDHKPREPIPPDHWRNYNFDVVKCLCHPDSNECCTKPDNERQHAVSDGFTDLMVNRKQIKRTWPSSGSRRRIDVFENHADHAGSCCPPHRGT